MGKARQYGLIALVSFLAALGGVLVARQIVDGTPPVENRIHVFLHDELELDAGQEARIHALERRYAERRRALEAEMRDDNAQLAAAIRAEHGYGPGVGAAIDRSHHAMGELQKETLRHIFAMRAQLRPDQARRFDEVVVSALTAPEQ